MIDTTTYKSRGITVLIISYSRRAVPKVRDYEASLIYVHNSPNMIWSSRMLSEIHLGDWSWESDEMACKPRETSGDSRTIQYSQLSVIFSTCEVTTITSPPFPETGRAV